MNSKRMVRLFLVILPGLAAAWLKVYLSEQGVEYFFRNIVFLLVGSLFFLATLVLIDFIRGNKPSRSGAIKKMPMAFLAMTIALIFTIHGNIKRDFRQPRPHGWFEDYKYNYAVPLETGDGWLTDDVRSTGIFVSAIGEIVERIVNREYPGIHSMLIARNGKLVVEEYFYDWTREKQHDLRSATKSITSAVTGTAIADGVFSGIEERVYPYFKEYDEITGGGKDTVTLKHLLTMSSGLDANDWDPDSPGNENMMYREDDWVKFILSQKLVNDPGSVTVYCTGGVVTIGAMIEKVVEGTFQEFADAKLFGPLGISEYEWAETPTGRTDTGGHLMMRPRDMLKIGQVFLNGGSWNGERVLPEEWVAESTSHQTNMPEENFKHPSYGYLWWRIVFKHNGEPTDSFQALGNGGQLIMVFPELEMVVVFTGGNYNSTKARAPFEIVQDILLPAVSVIK